MAFGAIDDAELPAAAVVVAVVTAVVAADIVVAAVVWLAAAAAGVAELPALLKPVFDVTEALPTVPIVRDDVAEASTVDGAAAALGCP